jgi:hypothetical protein
MPQSSYVAKVRLPNGSSEKVTVQAETAANAKAILEAQYGRGSVVVVSKA